MVLRYLSMFSLRPSAATYQYGLRPARGGGMRASVRSYRCERSPKLRVSALILSLTACIQALVAAEAPFVPAFDRFARHGDMETGVSGRLLLSELNCTACHRTPLDELAPKGGPDLNATGSRLRTDWVYSFLLNPTEIKPGTTMPHVLGNLSDANRRDAARALTAWLATLQQPFSEIKATGANPVPLEFWNHGDPKRGQQLYHQIGCVACHQPDGEYEVAEMKPSSVDEALAQLDPEDLAELGLAAAARRVNSVPHANTHMKYTRKSLTYFLLDPAKVRRGGRMPHFGLSPVDAAHIAAYQIQRDKADRQPTASETSFTDATELVSAGRQLFVKLGCANCHEANGVTGQTAVPLAELNATAPRNCLTGSGNGLPLYHIDEVQAESLRSVIGEQSQHLSDDAHLELKMAQLNCRGCHERGRIGGVGRYRKPYFETVSNIDIGDEGRLPPPLTQVGRKLKPKWIARVLDGKGAVRPHMHARMPRFGKKQVAQLPQLLTATDIHEDDQPTAEAVFGAAADLAPAGRQLMDAGCVQCHAFRGESLPGTVGVDLNAVTARVQPQWFHDFLLNPISLKERTRMPTFFPNGKSRNHEVLNGDTEKQIAAMWHYLHGLGRQPLPEKIITARNQNYELIADDGPVILRTFMKRAGTHAIAVALPGGVNFAFDAEFVRPALFWQGRFLDAEGTWFVRSAPPARPLAETVLELPDGASLAALGQPHDAWPHTDFGADGAVIFRGYRLDDSGVPIFLYSISGMSVEERYAPGPDQSLDRTITVRRPDQQSPTPLWLRALVGKAIVSDSASRHSNKSGLTVTVDGHLKTAMPVRKSGQGMEWLIRVPEQNVSTLKLSYQKGTVKE